MRPGLRADELAQERRRRDGAAGGGAPVLCPLSSVHRRDTRPSLQPRQHLPDLDDLIRLDERFEQLAGDRGRDLGVDLVGRHLDDRIALGDLVAGLLEPLEDGALGDRLPHLRHHQIDRLAGRAVAGPGRLLALVLGLQRRRVGVVADVGIALARRLGHARGGAGAIARSVPAGLELGERLADLDHLVRALEDLRQRPRGGGWDLGIDLVGRDLDEGLALLDAIPLLLEPVEHRPLGDRLAHRGHLDLDGFDRGHYDGVEALFTALALSVCTSGSPRQRHQAAWSRKREIASRRDSPRSTSGSG